MTEIKTVFEIKGKEYRVNRPGAKENRNAQMEYNKAFGAAIQSGAILRKKLEQYIIEQKIWSEEKANNFINLAKSIDEAEKKLASGGISLKDATKLAKKTREERAEMQAMLMERTSVDSNTAEGQAESARFQRLLVDCLVYKDSGETVFTNVESLLGEQDEEKLEVANKGFDILSQILYKLDDKLELNLPENKFLREWNLMDDKLRYLNEKGQPVDAQGRRINDEGLLINDEGQLVDGKGDLIDEKGDFIPKEVKPFLSDDGEPLTPPRKL